jgi:hypothetical protein
LCIDIISRRAYLTCIAGQERSNRQTGDRTAKPRSKIMSKNKHHRVLVLLAVGGSVIAALAAVAVPAVGACTGPGATALSASAQAAAVPRRQ